MKKGRQLGTIFEGLRQKTKNKLRRIRQKAEIALQKVANQPLVREIGDNNMNQYRNSGHHT
jgi:hypothetical protein